MIQLYKSKRAVPNNFELIDDVDGYFDAMYASGRLSFDTTDFEIMQRVDHIIAYRDGYIKTKFGDRAPVTCLSSGCKTCLLANHMKDTQVLSIEQCGANDLTELFNMDGHKYLLSFCCLPVQTELRYPVKVNSTDKLYKDTYELRKVWG